MTRVAGRWMLLVATALLSTVALAQAAPEQVIIVTAPRSLPVPDRLLGREDIDSYGAGSIGELIGEVLVEEGEDSPIILINGRRASGLEELSDYPPEALQQVEILPVGSGPKVGASPTRKVVNLVLQRRFDGRIGRAAYRAATEGGWSGGRVEGTATRVRGDSRFNLTLRARAESALLESERGLLQVPGSLPGEAEARTLVPSLRGTDLSLSSATQLAPEIDLSATGRLSWTERDSRLGLSPLGDRRDQQSRVLGGRINSTLNAQLGEWTVALLATLDADHRRVITELDALSATNRSLLRSASGRLDLTAARPLFALPAGAVQLNLGAGAGADRFRSTVRRSTGVVDYSRFTERTVSASAGLLVPIAGGPERLLRPLGELNLSGDLGITKVAGAGSFRTGSTSLTWQPVRALRFTAATSRASSPPATRFRREALVSTPGVLVLDPLTGESLRVTEFSGPLGSSVRARSSQERFAASFSPRSAIDLRLDSEWSSRRERDIVGDLPLASGAVLAAFPERFLRDPTGRLTGIDTSPVRFASRSETQWRNAINLRFNLSRAGARGGGGGEGDDEETPRAGRTRLQLTLAHTYLLASRLTLREGRAPIDLLSRDAILFAGGRPRHQLDFSANLSRRGMGVRVAADYRSASRVAVADGSNGPGELRFGSLATVSIRAFADAERLFGTEPLAKGTRISVNIANVANTREEVRDSAGRTPLAYQPAYRDPAGRTIEIELRRRF